MSVSPGLLRLLHRVSGKQEMINRLTEFLVIDSSKVRRVLNWKPPYSMEDELARGLLSGIRLKTAIKTAAL